MFQICYVTSKKTILSRVFEFFYNELEQFYLISSSSLENLFFRDRENDRVF